MEMECLVCIIFCECKIKENHVLWFLSSGFVNLSMRALHEHEKSYTTENVLGNVQ